MFTVNTNMSLSMFVSRLVSLCWVLTTCYATETYLMAVGFQGFAGNLSVSMGSSDGWVVVHYTSPERLESRVVKSWTAGVVQISQIDVAAPGVQDKMGLVRTSEENLQVLLYVDYSMTTLFPVSALGREYWVAGCHQDGFTSVLSIASNQEASISITQSNGQTEAISLGKLQTYTLRSSSDLTGMHIRASENIAVFSGAIFNGYMVAYTQLLPENLYDQKFLLKVDQDSYDVTILAASKFDVSINEEPAVNSNNNVFKTEIKSMAKMYIETSQPVVVTLCKINGYYSSFATLLPTSLYTTSTTLGVDDTASNLFVTILSSGSNSVTVWNNQDSTSSNIIWDESPVPGYKSGTITAPGTARRVTSESGFLILVFLGWSLYQVGYRKSQDLGYSQSQDFSSQTMAANTPIEGYQNSIPAIPSFSSETSRV